MQQPRGFVSQALSLVAQRILAELDPAEFRGQAAKPADVGAITRILGQIGDDEYREFARHKSRTAALCSARNYLAEIPGHEELLVFFGRRLGEKRSAGSKYYGVWKCVGDRNSVSLSVNLQKLINHAPHIERADVLLVHNHPPHWLKTVIGLGVEWRPTASETDRNTALMHEVQAILAGLNRGYGQTSFRWYLVEDGEIREFRIPSMGAFLELLDNPVEALRKFGIGA